MVTWNTLSSETYKKKEEKFIKFVERVGSSYVSLQYFLKEFEEEDLKYFLKKGLITVKYGKVFFKIPNKISIKLGINKNRSLDLDL